MDDQTSSPAPPHATDLSSLIAESGLDARAILRAVTRMSPLALVLSDPMQPDCPVVFCNAAFTKLTGYTEDEVIGRNCRFMQGPDTDPAAIRQLKQAIADRREDQVDLWNYRKDGSRFWNSMFIGPVFDRAGRLIYLFGSQTDATARWEAEAARVHVQQQDALKDMAAGMAGGIANLLSGVSGTAEKLIQRSTDSWEKEQLARITSSAASAGRLASQLLSFAGQARLNPKIADLNQLVTDFQRIAGQIVAPHVRVETIACEGALPARIDSGQLNLALFHLLRNASEASYQSGGKIHITTRAMEGGEAEIAVADDGAGMPPGMAAQAATPFFTTRDDGKSMGLGLSMVAGFCQQSGGHMTIESTPRLGTTVRLRFPRAAA